MYITSQNLESQYRIKGKYITSKHDYYDRLWNFTTHVSDGSLAPGMTLLFANASSLKSPPNATRDPSQSTRSIKGSRWTGRASPSNTNRTLGLVVVRAREFGLPRKADFMFSRRSRALMRLACLSSVAMPHSVSESGRCNAACSALRTPRHVTTCSLAPGSGLMSIAQGKSRLISRTCLGRVGVSGTRRNSDPRPAYGDDGAK